LYDLLNLNIYFDENYWLGGRKLLNSDIYQSSIFNWYYKYCYRKQKPLNNKFVKSGPQKLVNNILKAFEKRNDVVFNDDVYSNYYFCTYSLKYKNKIINVLKEDTKVIVGPLYTPDDFLELVNLTNKYKNLKIVCASNPAKKTMLKIANIVDQENTICVIPVGVSSEVQILKNRESKLQIQTDCLIYFKNRKKIELDKITDFLNSKNLSYKLFEYGKYSNSKLIKSAKTSKFGIVLGRTESQGIGINELMSTNLPLFVVDSKENHFNNEVYEGTSVPYWNQQCGIKIDDIHHLEANFPKFLKYVEGEKYNPWQLIVDKLSYEAMAKNLKTTFINISS